MAVRSATQSKPSHASRRWFGRLVGHLLCRLFARCFHRLFGRLAPVMLAGRSVGSSVCCADCLVSCSVGCVGCSAGSRLLGRPVVLLAAWSVARLVVRSVVSVVRSFVLVAQPLVRSVVRAGVSVVRSGDRSVVGQLFGGLFARWFIWRSGRLFHRFLARERMQGREQQM